jgi:hypothetical protein
MAQIGAQPDQMSLQDVAVPCALLVVRIMTAGFVNAFT